MTDLLRGIVDDLVEEQRALERVLERMRPEQFELATHAQGWAARDQVAHLAHFDDAATLAIQDGEGFKAYFRDPANSEAGYLARARKLTSSELVDWWRRASAGLVAASDGLDPAARIPWAGPAMSGVSFLTARLMETWSHGLDVVDVAGLERPDSDRLRHVAFLGVRALPFSYTNRRLTPPDAPIRVSLISPSGDTWEFGGDSNENVVRGTATDFCRVVTQRRHIADTGLEVSGPIAQEWMAIAQAFAGPPGPGRAPGEFAFERVR